MRIETPVLFDTSVVIPFQGQLKVLVSFFTEILIHQKVVEEIVEESLYQELQELIQSDDVKVVSDNFPSDHIAKALLKSCDNELRESFNIDERKDLGEYKSLLYAKFNDVSFFASQDTTVWGFVTKSLYFNDIECITLQDLAYLLYKNSKTKEQKDTARNLYRTCSKTKAYPWKWFKKYVKWNNDEIPNYIAFENNRLENYQALISSYQEEYCSSDQLTQNILRQATAESGSCKSCIYSRMDPKLKDISDRSCSLSFNFEDDSCQKFSEHFEQVIHKRHR